MISNILDNLGTFRVEHETSLGAAAQQKIRGAEDIYRNDTLLRKKLPQKNHNRTEHEFSFHYSRFFINIRSFNWLYELTAMTGKMLKRISVTDLTTY
jgi:hypothetical protein